MNRRVFRMRRRTESRPTLPPNRRRPTGDGEKKGSADDREPSAARRLITTALKLVATAVVTGGVVWAGLAAYRHTTTSAYFAVSEFEMSGLKRLAEEEVLAAAELTPGENVFKIDGERVAARLERHPWIAEAEVERRLPRHVSVQVTERRAVAVVLFDVPYLVGEAGEVFKRWAPGDPSPAPVITGFTREQFARDAQLVGDVIRDAVDLARRYRASGLGRTAPLDEIHYEVDGDFSLAIGGDSTYVRFGGGPYRGKLRKLATLLARLKRDGQRPAMIFFDNEVRPDRVTVKLKAAPGAGDEPPKTPPRPVSAGEQSNVSEPGSTALKLPPINRI